MRYERHLRIGLAAHAAVVGLAGVVVSVGQSPTVVFRAVGLALPITLVGSFSPDLDEPSSRAYRFFRPFVAATTAAFTYVEVRTQRRLVVAAVENTLDTSAATFVAGQLVVLFVVFVAGLAYFFVPPILQKPTHRGLYHQIPTVVVIGLVLYPMFVTALSSLELTQPLVTAGVFTTAFLSGYLSHIAADGLLLRRQTWVGERLDQAL